MSEVRLLVRDAERAIQAIRHGRFADRAIAALSADPETIEELNTALGRFIGGCNGNHFEDFSEEPDDRPYDAGLVIIDLPARLVICESTYNTVQPTGVVEYHDGDNLTDVFIHYELMDDWLLLDKAEGWQRLAEDRRKTRSLTPPFEARAILYGEPLLKFLAENCFDAFRDRMPAPVPDWEDLTQEPDPACEEEASVIFDVHKRWLMTPRQDLRGQTPRQVMHAKRRFLVRDLEERARQWSLLERCPPGLPPDSAAYRFAGFGIHESVVYYELVRELLRRCRKDVQDYVAGSHGIRLTREDFVAHEVRRLEGLRETWLDSPNPDYGGRIPRVMIHKERARIPELAREHEAVIDPDCPLCRLHDEFPEPTFWHLDGSAMDDDFAFSLWHETYEEWEQDRQEMMESIRRYTVLEAEFRRLGVEYPGEGYAPPDFAWKMSFSRDHFSKAPLRLRLFAIGGQACEIIADLKLARETGSIELSKAERQDRLIDRLTIAFQELRSAAESVEKGETPRIPPVLLTEFQDVLEILAKECPDQASPCVDLRDRLHRFLEPPSEKGSAVLYDDSFS